MENERIVIGIIGLGLMGGSAALQLKRELKGCLIIGSDISKENCDQALFLGIVDELIGMEEMTSRAHLIIVAVPVDKSKKIIVELLEKSHHGQVIIDFGSTKSAIAKVVKNHTHRGRYVACHPIAGTENNGPSAAFSSLYEGKVNIICDHKLSSKESLSIALDIIGTLGMRVKYMTSMEHDRHIAFVSHLSHISSFTLGQTVLEVEENEENIFDMAGSGFASTVRLAKSSPEMWAPIFVENSEHILEVLNAYIINLEKYKSMIEQGDDRLLKDTMKNTNRIRTVLEARTLETEIKSNAINQY